MQEMRLELEHHQNQRGMSERRFGPAEREGVIDDVFAFFGKSKRSHLNWDIVVGLVKGGMG